jgi:hypothetical protein
VRSILSPDRQQVFDVQQSTSVSSSPPNRQFSFNVGRASARSSTSADNNEGLSIVNRTPAIASSSSSPIADVLNNIQLPSKHVSGINENTRLLDIPSSKYGTMLGWVQSITFIPEKHIKRIRRVFSNALGAIIQDSENVLNWRKLFLLPSLILVRCSKTELNARLSAIRDDDWNFTVGDVISKHIIAPKLSSNEKRVIY